MTGPIAFSDSDARRYLLREGAVYTLRPEDRTTGSTWLRLSRTGPKVGDVEVERVVEQPSERDLRRYASRSGLGTPQAWTDAAQVLHETGDDVLDGLSIYRVRLVDVDDDLLD